jgi:hypothetical protein
MILFGESMSGQINVFGAQIHVFAFVGGGIGITEYLSTISANYLLLKLLYNSVKLAKLEGSLIGPVFSGTFTSAILYPKLQSESLGKAFAIRIGSNFAKNYAYQNFVQQYIPK